MVQAPQWWIDFVNSGREAERRQYSAMNTRMPYANQNPTTSKVISGGLQNNVGKSRIYKSATDLPGLNTVPRDSSWTEAQATTPIAIAAAPNVLRIQTCWGLHNYTVINDESVVVFDRFELSFNYVGASTYYPHRAHFFLVKGPNNLTLNTGNYDPTSVGFRDAMNTDGANGMEVTFFQTIELEPKLENGSWTQTRRGLFELKEELNAFVSETETALSQGRSAPKLWLVVACVGTASTTDNIYWLSTRSTHYRKRVIRP